MKTKHFYSHLIQINDITLDLAGIEMTQEERIHLLALVDANVHTAVVKTVLNELDEKEKKVFLKNLISHDHIKTWDHLSKNSKDLEDKIKITAEKLIKELRLDLKKLKN